MLKKMIQGLVAIMVILGLTACNFQPHRAGHTSLTGKVIYVTSPDSQSALVVAVRQALQQRRLNLAASRKRADLVLDLSDVRLWTREPSLNTSSRMRIYPVTFRLRYSILAENRIILANRLMTIRQNYVVHENRTLLGNNQLRVMSKQMVELAADRLVSQLAKTAE